MNIDSECKGDFVQFLSKSPEETSAFAIEFAKNLPEDCFITLSGDLGTGKTTFVKGLALGLGIKNRVKSPSFNIMSIYDIDEVRKLVHIDAYRLDSYEHFENLLLDEIAPSPRIVCVEWAENVKESIPEDVIKIVLSIDDNNNHLITVEKF